MKIPRNYKGNYAFIAQDQCGSTWWIKRHPRKELMEVIGRQHVQKMYVDTATGPVHTGYVIGGHWLTVMGLEGCIFRA
jgi:hypothetical protein